MVSRFGKNWLVIFAFFHNVMKAVRSARWDSIRLFVPRLVNAIASWSQAVSIAKPGRREAMAKHIKENLG